MRNSINIAVKAPCSEKWNQMSPTDKGKFCGSCQKEVVDFSSMSDTELYSFFARMQGQSLCGRFLTKQLDRPLQQPRSRPRFPVLYGVFKWFLPLIVANKGYTQGTPVREVRDSVVSVNSLNTKGKFETDTLQPVKTAKETNQVRGRVVDQDRFPIQGAAVMIADTTIGTVTDSAGRFVLNGDSLKIAKALEIFAVGMEPQTYSLPERFVDSADLIEIEMLVVTMGVVIVVESKAPSIPLLTDNGKMDDLIVYPNPVQSGGNLTLGLQDLPTDEYLLEIIDASGKTVVRRKHWIDDNVRVIDMTVPVLRSGTYFLRLRRKNDPLQRTTRFMVK